MDLLLSREPIGRGSLEEEPRRRPEHSTGKHEAARPPRRRRQDWHHQRRRSSSVSPGPRPPRSTLEPTECRTPRRGSSSCPRRGEGRARGPPQRRSSSHARWRWFFPAAVSVLLPARMMVVVASRMQLPLLLLRPSSWAPREEEPNHPPLSDSLVLTGSRHLSRHPLLVNR